MNDLRHFLDREGHSMSELARRVGVSPSTIYRIIRGERRPSIDLATRIAAKTGIPVKSLLPDTAKIFGAA